MLKLIRAIALSTLAPLVIVGFAASVTAQETPSQSDECTSLIDLANQAVSEVQTATQNTGAGDEAVLLEIAAIAERSTASMNEIEVLDPQLQGFRDRFITMYTSTSEAARELVTAVQAQDESAAQQAYEAIVTATNQEAPLVNEINAYCNRPE